jgi:hypothetical protein
LRQVLGEAGAEQLLKTTIEAAVDMGAIRRSGSERVLRRQRVILGRLLVECIGKGKARQPFEFGFKVSLAVTHKAAWSSVRSASPASRTTATRWLARSNTERAHRNLKRPRKARRPGRDPLEPPRFSRRLLRLRMEPR